MKIYGKRLKKEEFIKPQGSKFNNKPQVGGLWACNGDEWLMWCCRESFRLSTLDYGTEFSFKSDIIKEYVIDSHSDYMWLLDNYGNKREDVLDWDKICEVYQVVTLTMKGNLECHLNPLDIIGLHAWDVPCSLILNWDAIDEDSIRFF